MRPAPHQIRIRLFSYPGWRTHHLAQSDLEAFVGGLVKGCLHEHGAIGQKPGKDVFLPLNTLRQLLWASYRLHTVEDPFGYAVKWKFKPRQDPD